MQDMLPFRRPSQVASGSDFLLNKKRENEFFGRRNDSSYCRSVSIERENTFAAFYCFLTGRIRMSNRTTRDRRNPKKRGIRMRFIFSLCLPAFALVMPWPLNACLIAAKCVLLILALSPDTFSPGYLLLSSVMINCHSADKPINKIDLFCSTLSPSHHADNRCLYVNIISILYIILQFSCLRLSVQSVSF